MLIKIIEQQEMKLKSIILWLPVFIVAWYGTACTKPEPAKLQNQLSEPKTFEWQMMTVWPTKLDILTEGIKKFVEKVRIISNNRLKITLIKNEGEQSVFDAVSSGKIQIGHSVAYLWTDKIPAAQFMASVPFGMDARQHFAWLNHGDGLKLWRALYREHHIIPFPMGNTGMQMAGWFKKPIEEITDFRDRKIRLQGIAGEVLVQDWKTRPTLLQPDNLVEALENDTLDAVEWMGPYYDKALGLHTSKAKNYYFPGWHEPGTTLELLINKQAWETLPNELKTVIETVANEIHQWIYTEFEAKNAQALKELESSKNIEIREFPSKVLSQLRKNTQQLLQQKAEADDNFKKVYESYREFQETMDRWMMVNIYE